jgi:hypothetical protein
MPREISLKMVVKNSENVKPSTIIAKRKKRIDPRKRIWEAIEKHNNREQTFAYHEWIKCNFKSHQLIIQETDCN